METRQTLTLTQGETAKVRLPGLGTSGYLWTLDQDTADERLRIEHDFEPHDNAATRGIGASVDEVFRITPSSTGQFTLRFRQVRSWEAAKPRSSHVVTMTVAPAAEPT